MQWLGKLWHEFYRIPRTHNADKIVDPFDDYIEESGKDQEVEDNIQETEQMPAIIEDTNEGEDELIATRTQSHDTEPTASITRRQQDLTEMAGFANVKIGTNMKG